MRLAGMSILAILLVAISSSAAYAHDGWVNNYVEHNKYNYDLGTNTKTLVSHTYEYVNSPPGTVKIEDIHYYGGSGTPTDNTYCYNAGGNCIWSGLSSVFYS